MTRNLSLIPTIESEPEAAPPATPPRAAPPAVPREKRLRVAIAPARRPPIRAPVARATWRRYADELVVCGAIVLFFAAIAWPLYVWIGG